MAKTFEGIKGIGPKKRELLNALGINDTEDILYSWPRTWEDRRNRVNISQLKEGEAAGFTATVVRITRRPAYYAKGKSSPFAFICSDGTGEIEAVFFGARWIERLIEQGGQYRFFGTPQPAANRLHLQIIHPEFEKASEETAFAAHPILPVYPLTKGISQKDMRKWHEQALPAARLIDEYLPHAVLESENLCGIDYALSQIHFPEGRDALSAAKYRLVFEELFVLQTGLMKLKRTGTVETGGIAYDRRPEAGEFERLLPFEFTGAQKRVVGEIYKDMERPRPMNRLVQGDVGSGKTAVAAAAVYKALKNGYQAVMMAPTEILAKQHFADLSKLFEENKIGRSALLTSGMKAADRRAVLEGLADGSIAFAVGTHALIQPDVRFSNLGLVITDEQHRFGVNQRIGLAKKRQTAVTSGSPAATSSDTKITVTAVPAVSPDVLVMTATPIPRSLAFVLYGDLDMSVIGEMPPGRKSVITKAVTSRKRTEVYDFVRAQLEKGGQAYVVAPLIEDSEGSEIMDGVRSAMSLYDELAPQFEKYGIALLHGGMKQSEKDAVMQDFVSGRTGLLVSTVVIEVGVNVQNATIMVIENAERFGLAQLHQLRGRVGRGRAQSYCVLVSDSKSDEADRRAKTMTNTDDGFAIAEQDLAMRGPGELFGVRQHGLPTLKIADLAKHVRIAEKARDAAAKILETDPELVSPANRAFGDRVENLFRSVSEIGL
jgi:ATP-dependent DNA helicase RecG